MWVGSRLHVKTACTGTAFAETIAGGMGMGLALCREIALKHGGSLTAAC